MSEQDARGPGFWVAYGVGAALVAWGVWLFVDATSPGELVGFGVSIVASDLIIDAIAIPVVLLVGWVVGWSVPPWARAPVQVALIVTGTVLVIGLLPLVGSAASTGNPTIQPIDYPMAIGITLAVVWVAAAAWALWRRRSTRA